MQADEWRRINDLFHGALERDPGERAAFIARDCAGDEGLRCEVESLLASHDPSDNFISSLAPDLAAGLLAESHARLATGQSVGNYRVMVLLGAGGMGEVYLTEDTRLGRRVALKLLPAQFTTEPDRLHRFEREARAASSLNHPNIITIHEVGQVEGEPFIITEFIEGKTLRQQMAAAKMRLGESLDVAIQVASALEAAHKAGIVHRDIKPENIMLRPDGLVKVLDFGLAKLTESQSHGPGAEATALASVQTKTGLVIGTVTYMSPEQARGLAVDARSDIFSLGTVIYEMIAGQVPFEGATTSDVIVSILEREPAPLSPNKPGVPAELVRIVKKALAKDRGERYQLAKDFLIDLRNLKQEIELRAKLDAARTDDLKGATPAGLHVSLDTDEQLATRSTDAEVGLTVQSAAYLIGKIKTHERAVAIGLAALLIAVAAIVYVTYFTRGGEAIDSIAVLPFVNVGNDANAEYLSDGISDGIINSLSQLPNLKDVISFSSVRRYKGKEIDPQAVGRELNVAAVLTGRLSLRGDEVLVSTELVDVEDNRRLWGGQFNRKLANVFTLQGEIAQQISERLRLKLSGEQKERLTKPSTENAEAYQLYLQGLYYWWKNTDEATLKSGEYFQHAIEKDPNFGLAHVGLADYYIIMSGFGNMRSNEALPKAEAAAVKALAIDERLVDAHRALAAVKMWYDWDWPGAERELKRAIELNPEGFHRGLYNRLLEVTGRIDEAIADASVDWNEPPGSRLARDSRLPRLLFIAGRYGEALEAWRKTIEKGTSRREIAHLGMGEIYLKQGRYEEALSEMLEVRPRVRYPRELARIGYVYAAAGKRREAIKILEEMKGLTGKRYNLGTHIAAIYAALGNKDEALAWLKKACDDYEQGVVELKVDPRFDTLRSDARFIDLLRRVKLAP
jgi:serine/threonine-protein kinase